MNSDKQGIRISELPAGIRPSARNLAKELDSDGDGFFDEDEFARAVNTLHSARKQNRSLIKMAAGLCLTTLLLAAAVLGCSIAAAHLSKDTNVDDDGVLHAKSTGSVVKTSQALVWSKDGSIVGKTNRELAELAHLSMLDGSLHFHVKGFARAPEEEKVVLLVEGGTLTFDGDGMVDATGDALSLINTGAGQADLGEEGETDRKLYYGYNGYNGLGYNGFGYGSIPYGHHGNNIE